MHSSFVLASVRDGGLFTVKNVTKYGKSPKLDLPYGKKGIPYGKSSIPYGKLLIPYGIE